MTWDRGGKTDARYNSKRWKAIRRIVLRNAVCALCGHGAQHGSPPGSVDHRIPVELASSSDQFFDRANLSAMHDVRSPCLVCQAAYRANGLPNKGCCNELKAANPISVARKRLQKGTGLDFGEVPGSYRPPAPEEPFDW